MHCTVIPFYLATGRTSLPLHSASTSASIQQRGDARPVPIVWDQPMNYQQYLALFYPASNALCGAGRQLDVFPSSGVSVAPPTNYHQMRDVYLKLRNFVTDLLTVPASNFTSTHTMDCWQSVIDIGFLSHMYATFPASRDNNDRLFDGRRARLSARALMALLDDSWMQVTRSAYKSTKVDVGFAASLLWPSLGVGYGGRYFTSLDELGTFLDKLSAGMEVLRMDVLARAEYVNSVRLEYARVSATNYNARYYRKYKADAKPFVERALPTLDWSDRIRQPDAPPMLEDITALLLLFWSLHTPLMPAGPIERGSSESQYARAHFPMPPEQLGRSFGWTHVGEGNANTHWCHACTSSLRDHIVGCEESVRNWMTTKSEPLMFNKLAGSAAVIQRAAANSRLFAMELLHSTRYHFSLWAELAREKGIDTEPRLWPAVRQMTSILESYAGRSERVLNGTTVTWAPPVTHLFDRIAAITPELEGELPGVIPDNNVVAFPSLPSSGEADIASEWKD